MLLGLSCCLVYSESLQLYCEALVQDFATMLHNTDVNFHCSAPAQAFSEMSAHRSPPAHPIFLAAPLRFTLRSHALLTSIARH